MVVVERGAALAVVASCVVSARALPVDLPGKHYGQRFFFLGGGSGRFKAPPSLRCAEINLQVLSDYILCPRFLLSPHSVQGCLLFSKKSLRMQRTQYYLDTAFSKEFTQKLHTKVENCTKIRNVCSYLDSSSFAPSSLGHLRRCDPFCSCASKRAFCSACEVVFWFTSQLEHVYPRAASRRWCAHRVG